MVIMKTELAAPRKHMGESARKAIQMAKETGAKMMDLKFNDLSGLWQHFSIPVNELDVSLFAEGIGFDGSSIRVFKRSKNRT